MGRTKDYPYCGERIKEAALLCRYGHSRVSGRVEGTRVRVRLKGPEKSYRGDLFVPAHFRMSDVINDERPFLILTNAVEETKATDHQGRIPGSQQEFRRVGLRGEEGVPGTGRSGMVDQSTWCR
jgi:hypothetical protein